MLARELALELRDARVARGQLCLVRARERVSVAQRAQLRVVRVAPEGERVGSAVCVCGRCVCAA